LPLRDQGENPKFCPYGQRRASEGSRGVLDSSSLLGEEREGRTGRKNGTIFIVAF